MTRHNAPAVLEAPTNVEADNLEATTSRVPPLLTLSIVILVVMWFLVFFLGGAFR